MPARALASVMIRSSSALMASASRGVDDDFVDRDDGHAHELAVRFGGGLPEVGGQLGHEGLGLGAVRDPELLAYSKDAGGRTARSGPTRKSYWKARRVVQSFARRPHRFGQGSDRQRFRW